MPAKNVLLSEKRFDFGFDVESTHYADREKDYPLLSAVYEPSAEQEAEKEAARQCKEMGLDLRRTAARTELEAGDAARAKAGDVVAGLARLARAYTRAQVRARQVINALVPPAASPEDLAKK
jgi:hypothetical protein